MQKIPLTQIDTTAFPRDRGEMEPEDLQSLITSISKDGLRTPIEVCQTEDGYALLSGFRRHAAFTELAKLNDTWSEIPATLRAPGSHADALRLIAEENAIREGISPWDQSRYAADCVDQGYFETLDAAIAAIYGALSRQKRSRLRAVAEVVEHMGGILTEPHTWSGRQLTRLAAGIRGDFTGLMLAALSDQSDQSPAAQWKTLSSILSEAERSAAGELKQDPRPGRPHRRLRLTSRLTVRREWREDGWTLVFTGPNATGPLMDTLMDELERLTSP